MKKIIAKIVYFFAGWKLNNPQNKESIRRSVMIAAPHTSNWDLLYALGGFWLMEVDVKYFIKDGYTKGIFGFFFRWTGAIGVNQKQNTQLSKYAIKLFKERKNLVLLVPAEGTRQAVNKWRTGFYTIAEKAGVPVSLGYLDYKNKESGVAGLVPATGNFEKDMEKIQAVYSPEQAKYPDQYNPKIY
jgi:1-acyl-sn-glycerol-3-phosphate acyltransferase